MTRRAGFAWPIVLVSVGVIALLVNFGVLNVSWSSVLRLWPLILVLVGIDLLVGHRSPPMALALEALVVLGAVAILAASPSPASAGETSSRVERDGAARLELRLEVGAGRFEVRGGATQLVEATSTRDDIVEETSRSGDAAVVELRSDGPPAFFRAEPTEWVVRVASDVPTELRVSGGAGEFIFDFSDIRVTGVRISTGATSLRLVLPRPDGDVPVRIESGASSIVIEIPAAVEARVSASGAAISVDGSTETPGYANARDRVTVTINAAATSVTIR